MKIGIMADIHDNVDNLRHAIGLFNAVGCRAVLLAGKVIDFAPAVEGGRGYARAMELLSSGAALAAMEGLIEAARHPRG